MELLMCVPKALAIIFAVSGLIAFTTLMVMLVVMGINVIKEEINELRGK